MRKMLGVALVLALGCGDDKNTTMATDGGTGGSSGTGETTSNPTSTTHPTSGTTTDTGGTMGGSQTMGETETSPTTTDTGGGMTTGTGTTTEPQTTSSTGNVSVGSTTMGGGGLEEACTAACDKFAECQVGPDPNMCVQGCVENFSGAEGPCLMANQDMLACMGTMTCDEVLAFFMNDEPGPCAAQFEAVNVQCMNMGDCTVGVGGNPQGTECSYTKECMGEPPVEMQCNKDECICLIDGMQAGDPCPADNVCKMQDTIDVKANDCCGF